MTFSWFVTGADDQPARAKKSTLVPNQGMVRIYGSLERQAVAEQVFRSRGTPGLCECRLTAKTSAFQAEDVGSTSIIRSRGRVAPCYVGRSWILPQKMTMVAENCTIAHLGVEIHPGIACVIIYAANRTNVGVAQPVEQRSPKPYIDRKSVV